MPLLSKKGSDFFCVFNIKKKLRTWSRLHLGFFFNAFRHNLQPSSRRPSQLLPAVSLLRLLLFLRQLLPSSLQRLLQLPSCASEYPQASDLQRMLAMSSVLVDLSRLKTPEALQSSSSLRWSCSSIRQDCPQSVSLTCLRSTRIYQRSGRSSATPEIFSKRTVHWSSLSFLPSSFPRSSWPGHQ